MSIVESFYMLFDDDVETDVHLTAEIRAMGITILRELRFNLEEVVSNIDHWDDVRQPFFANPGGLIFVSITYTSSFTQSDDGGRWKDFIRMITINHQNDIGY